MIEHRPLQAFDFLAIFWIVIGVFVVFGFGALVGIERSRTERVRYENGCIEEVAP